MSLGFLSYLCGGLQKSRKHVVITGFLLSGVAVGTEKSEQEAQSNEVKQNTAQQEEDKATEEQKEETPEKKEQKQKEEKAEEEKRRLRQRQPL
jgi:hypothetical protein